MPEDDPNNEPRSRAELPVGSPEGDLPDALLPAALASGLSTETASLAEIRRVLIERIGHLLDHNRPLLFSALYRIDVSEALLQDVLSKADPASLPSQLADLVIDRQLRKIHFRRRYRSP